MSRARELADSADKDIVGTLTVDGIEVDSGTIKLDGNYPTGTENVALGDTALDSVESGGQYNVAVGSKAGNSATTITELKAAWPSCCGDSPY